MYAQSIVEQRIALASRELGFPLEYHSPADIDTFEAQLRSKYEAEYSRAESDSQGKDDAASSFQISLMRCLADPSRPRLTEEETRFIQNDRYLSMCDAAYFLTRYYVIKTPERIQRFTFLPGQRVFFNVIASIESLGMPVELICGKARQHGVSTEVEGITLHRANFGYGTNCVVASADRQKTGKMAQMTFLGYDSLPWWLRTLSTRRVESDQGMLVFGGSKSGISFQHGAQTSGIARGDTVKVYHLSEVASYTNPEQQIEASLFRCVHPHADVFGCLESTAEGDSGWFYDTYWYSKKNWKDRRARLATLFLPWFLGTDKYPTPTWIRTHPPPQDWRPAQETREMVARAQLYITTDNMLSRVLGAKWRMPIEQQWYWEVNFLEHRSKGKERLWKQEMPTDDREMFQGSFDNVFGRDVTAEIFSQRTTRYAVYSIVGQSIETRHEPDPQDFDDSLPIIPVAYKSRKGQTYRWELQPMKWAEDFSTLEELRDASAHMGKLFVYLPPDPGYDYSIGVDTSNGIGSDSTVIAVSRRGRSPEEPDVQAAEFRWDKVSHVDAYAFVLCIAAYYGRFMGENTRYREPYVAVEQIAAVGDTVQLQMSNMGYSRFHKMTRYDSDPAHMRKSASHSRGWYTNAWSRPVLTDTFVTWVSNGWYILNSPYTIYECDHWEVRLTGSGKEKYEHADDTTDDGIFANGMAAFCPNDRQTMAERSTKRLPDSAAGQMPALDIGAYRGHTVNVDTPTRTVDRWDGSDLRRYV